VQGDEFGALHIPVGLLDLRFQIGGIGQLLVAEVDDLGAGTGRDIDACLEAIRFRCHERVLSSVVRQNGTVQFYPVKGLSPGNGKGVPAGVAQCERMRAAFIFRRPAAHPT
jgi:hypothetical protein